MTKLQKGDFFASKLIVFSVTFGRKTKKSQPPTGAARPFLPRSLLRTSRAAKWGNLSSIHRASHGFLIRSWQLTSQKNQTRHFSTAPFPRVRNLLFVPACNKSKSLHHYRAYYNVQRTRNHAHIHPYHLHRPRQRRHRRTPRRRRLR